MKFRRNGILFIAALLLAVDVWLAISLTELIVWIGVAIVNDILLVIMGVFIRKQKPLHAKLLLASTAMAFSAIAYAVFAFLLKNDAFRLFETPDDVVPGGYMIGGFIVSFFSYVTGIVAIFAILLTILAFYVTFGDDFFTSTKVFAVVALLLHILFFTGIASMLLIILLIRYTSLRSNELAIEEEKQCLYIES